MGPVSEESQPIRFELCEMATEGDVLLFPKLVGSSGNLRTTFHKIIERAGSNPWPRLSQNLRASRATDWAGEHPLHESSKWLGHSPAIAAKHYLQPRDLHFKGVTGTGEWRGSNAENDLSQSGAESGAARL